MADPDEQGPFLVQKSTGAPTEDMYRPLQDPGVFRKLAALRAAPDEVRDFADQYGFLGHPVPLLARDGTVPIWGALRRTPASTKYGAQYHIDLAQFPTGEADRIRRQLWTMHAPLGESFSFWEDEIRRAHLLLFFWDLLEQKEAGKLGKFLIWDTNPLAVKMEFAHGGSGEITPAEERRRELDRSGGKTMKYGGQIITETLASTTSTTESSRLLLDRWNIGDVIEPVEYWVQLKVDEQVFGYVSPMVLPFSGGDIVYHPDCLHVRSTLTCCWKWHTRCVQPYCVVNQDAETTSPPWTAAKSIASPAALSSTTTTAKRPVTRPRPRQSYPDVSLSMQPVTMGIS